MSQLFNSLKFYIATSLGEVTWLRGSDITLPVAPPTAASFIPPDDNVTDLGSAAKRFHSLYVGTSIKNAGNLAIDLSGAGTRTLAIGNSDAGVCDVTVDGNVTAAVNLFSLGDATAYDLLHFRSGTAFDGTFQCALTASHDWTFPDTDGTVTLNAATQTLSNKTLGNTTVVTSFLGSTGTTVVSFSNSASTVNHIGITSSSTGFGCAIQPVGGDANIPISIGSLGTANAILNGGDGVPKVSVNNTGIGEFNVAPTAQSAAIPDASGGAVIDAEARAALNSLLAYFRLRGTVAL